MNQLAAKEFRVAWLLLDKAAELASKKKGERASEEERSFLIKALIEVNYQCGKLHFTQSARSSELLLGQLKDPAFHREWRDPIVKPGDYTMPERAPLPSFDTVHWHIQQLIIQINAEMEHIRLAVISGDSVRFLERDDLFGKDFHQKASPELNAEIKAAANCLATGLDTAAVFHLMRASEFGLRKLARKLKVKLKYPLEFGEWGAVIDACDAELKALKPATRGKRKSAQLEFLANAISDCRAFKETWRDCVMHARRTHFSPGEAKLVFERVHTFLKRLAGNVSLK